MADPERYDVLIVGGGISGLYAAWRLGVQTDGPPLKICLREGSERLGGRLDTRVVPGTATRVELGAMRFPPAHKLVEALLGELKVETELFPGQDFVHLYLRGQPLPFSAAQGGAQPIPDLPYRLAGSESTNPNVLGITALLRIVPDLQVGKTGIQKRGADPDSEPATAAEIDQILSGIKVDGRPLWQWGFWNLLSRVVSNEAYMYLEEAFAVESAVSNWNGLSALKLLFSVVGDAMAGHLRHPIGGWFELVDALEQIVMKLPNVTIVKMSTALSVSKDVAPDVPFVVSFFDHVEAETHSPAPPASAATASSDLSSAFRTRVEANRRSKGPRISGMVNHVEAGKVILALPARAIELIDIGQVAMTGFAKRQVTDTLRRKMAQVLRVPAFRIYVTYKEPWWQRWCGWSSGYAVTDLPLRQVFYGFGLSAPTPAEPKADEVRVNEANNSRVLMASYANAATTDFWMGLVERGVRVREYSGNDANEHLPIREAINRQLKDLHGYAFDFPDGQWACSVDWAADPYGAAWHAWRPNVDINKAIPEMRQPIPGLKLFICGEAFSHIQGWIEGTLCSTEQLLQEQFQLKQATWIPVGYPLGPRLAPKSLSSTAT